ncbi:MAG: outer membrane protein assembly factor BamE, partial [Gammaproteobacteria bacterium]
MKKLLIIMTCIASLTIAACSRYHLVHKIDVQQGNVITQDEVNLLEPGMNRRQVQFVMGSPMIADVFHQDRWDYVYLLEPG